MYIIKKFEDRYNDEVNNFIISVFVEEYGFEQFREGLKEQNNHKYIENGSNLWIAIDENDNIVGTIALRKHNNEEAEIKKLYVRKDYRGTGLSKELYRKVMEEAKSKEFSRIFLGTYDKLESAIHFYLKRGFTQIDELYNEEEGARYFELYVV